MAQKTTGNRPEGPLAFSALLRWHMDRGTRPSGSPEAEGLPWSVKELANAAGTTDRSLGSWRNGGHPEDLRPLENAFFGKEADTKYAWFRDELRRAYRLARSGNSGIKIGPQSTIHDPGLCLGRDSQIDRLVLKLISVQAGASILVLGDAGHGKTILAEKVGVHQHIVQRFGERRWFVELERADGAVSTLAEIAASIGLERTAPLPAVQTRLAAKPGLLVLDNLETPLHVDGRATETLLRDLISIPGLALIASLRGQETIASVPWTDQIWLEPLPPDVARTVFLSIAPNVRENDPDLDYFLGELDGIPLAIRLVAKRASTRHSNLIHLRRQWQRKGALLAEEPGGEGSRRDSLVASVEFSLVSRRMREAGKRLFSILGQLPAGLAIDDLDVVLRDEGDNAADQLRQVGLLKDSDGRVGLLSPIRDISRRRHQPDAAAMKSWIMNYLQLSREEGDRIGKEGGAAAIVRLIPEMANIGAAISASANDPEHRSEAISALEGFARAMRYTGISGEAVIDELDKACADAADIVGRAKCMIARAGAARMRSENDSARADYRRALELVRGRDDDLEAPCIGGLADIARMRSDNEAARALYDEARALYKRAGSLIGEAGCIFGLAEIARMRSDNEAASDLYSEARDLYRSAGALSGEAQCIWGLASIAQTRLDDESAHKLYSEARDISACGSVDGRSPEHLGLGRTCSRKERLPTSASAL
jgi:tetratricopeptide (TPR) repeat protein